MEIGRVWCGVVWCGVVNQQRMDGERGVWMGVGKV